MEACDPGDLDALRPFTQVHKNVLGLTRHSELEEVHS